MTKQLRRVLNIYIFYEEIIRRINAAMYIRISTSSLREKTNQQKCVIINDIMHLIDRESEVRDVTIDEVRFIDMTFHSLDLFVSIFSFLQGTESSSRSASSRTSKDLSQFMSEMNIRHRTSSDEKHRRSSFEM
jgi:hypothetical protein